MPPKKKAPRIMPPTGRDTVKVEILLCASHSVYAVAIDNQRITPAKCCGSWRSVRTYLVSKSEIRELVQED